MDTLAGLDDQDASGTALQPRLDSRTSPATEKRRMFLVKGMHFILQTSREPLARSILRRAATGPKWKRPSKNRHLRLCAERYTIRRSVSSKWFLEQPERCCIIPLRLVLLDVHGEGFAFYSVVLFAARRQLGTHGADWLSRRDASLPAIA